MSLRVPSASGSLGMTSRSSYERIPARKLPVRTLPYFPIRMDDVLAFSSKVPGLSSDIGKQRNAYDQCRKEPLPTTAITDLCYPPRESNQRSAVEALWHVDRAERRC